VISISVYGVEVGPGIDWYLSKPNHQIKRFQEKKKKRSTNLFESCFAGSEVNKHEVLPL
jgi:hypothetical protein